jgi:hypothetical protein
MGAKGWIGVDLDGTLAEYTVFKGAGVIGAPIPLMVERVKRWLQEGKDVRIFTARVDGGTVALNAGNPDGQQFLDVEAVKRPIREWCIKHLGRELPITNTKDYAMIELWDDRCVQVETNTGRRIGAPAMWLAMDKLKDREPHTAYLFPDPPKRSSIDGPETVTWLWSGRQTGMEVSVWVAKRLGLRPGACIEVTLERAD